MADQVDPRDGKVWREARAGTSHVEVSEMGPATRSIADSASPSTCAMPPAATAWLVDSQCPNWPGNVDNECARLAPEPSTPADHHSIARHGPRCGPSAAAPERAPASAATGTAAARWRPFGSCGAGVWARSDRWSVSDGRSVASGRQVRARRFDRASDRIRDVPVRMIRGSTSRLSSSIWRISLPEMSRGVSPG
jgi:hypothetical protein